MCNGDSCLNYENGVGLYVCYKLQTCHLLTDVTDMIQTQKEEERLIERIQSSKGLEFSQKGSPRKIISSEMDKKALQIISLACYLSSRKVFIVVIEQSDIWEIVVA